MRTIVQVKIFESQQTKFPETEANKFLKENNRVWLATSISTACTPIAGLITTLAVTYMEEVK
jgi:hypothetical protein